MQDVLNRNLIFQTIFVWFHPSKHLCQVLRAHQLVVSRIHLGRSRTWIHYCPVGTWWGRQRSICQLAREPNFEIYSSRSGFGNAFRFPRTKKPKHFYPQPSKPSLANKRKSQKLPSGEFPKHLISWWVREEFRAQHFKSYWKNAVNGEKEKEFDAKPIRKAWNRPVRVWISAALILPETIDVARKQHLNE